MIIICIVLGYLVCPGTGTRGINHMNLQYITPIGVIEPYLYSADPSGACYGITEQIFIPTTLLINNSTTNNSSPFYIQSLLESSLQLKFSKVHVWITEECDISMKKYFCSSTMIAPQWLTRSEILSMNNISDRSDLMIRGGGVYVPSYPHHSVCTEYASVCRDYISRSGLEFLKPDCDAIVVNGRRIDDVEMAVAAMMFPSSNQTVYTAQMFINDNNSSSSGNIYHLVNISLISSPNTLSEVDESRWSHHHPDCPSGFVVPDDQTDPDVRWVSGSGCAVACKSPVWTDEEWLIFDTLTKICALTGMICGIPFVITWAVVKEKRKQYLVLCFAVTSTMATASYLPLLFFPYEQRFCRNNAVSYNASDGFTMCAVQSVILLYSANGMYFSWLCLCIDIFLQLCAGFSRTTKFFGIYMFIVFGVPLLIVIIMLALGEFGYYAGTMECYAKKENNIDVYLFSVPSFLVCIIGGILMVNVIRKIIESIKKTSGSTGGQGDKKKFMKKFEMLRIPVLFVMILLSASAGVFVSRGVQFTDPATIFVNKEWEQCIFDNYYGIDSIWRRECGSYAGHRTHPVISGYFMCCSAGGSILISAIYLLNPSVIRLWSKWLHIEKIQVCISKIFKIMNGIPVISHVLRTMSFVYTLLMRVVWKKNTRDVVDSHPKISAFAMSPLLRNISKSGFSNAPRTRKIIFSQNRPLFSRSIRITSTTTRDITRIEVRPKGSERTRRSSLLSSIAAVAQRPASSIKTSIKYVTEPHSPYAATLYKQKTAGIQSFSSDRNPNQVYPYDIPQNDDIEDNNNNHNSDKDRNTETA